MVKVKFISVAHFKNKTKPTKKPQSASHAQESTIHK